MSTRYKDNVTRGRTVDVLVDGQSVTVYEGETIATALLLGDSKACYRTGSGSPRMMFCNMGTCFECRVRVTQSGKSRWVLACTTPVQAHMEIDTNVVLAQWMPGQTDDV